MVLDKHTFAAKMSLTLRNDFDLGRQKSRGGPSGAGKQDMGRGVCLAGSSPWDEAPAKGPEGAEGDAWRA